MSGRMLCSGVLVAGLVMAGSSSAVAQGGRFGRRDDNAPKVGQKAPEFNLTVVTASKEAREVLGHKKKEPPKTLKLSAFRDKKPVVLAFGSFT